MYPAALRYCRMTGYSEASSALKLTVEDDGNILREERILRQNLRAVS